MVQVNALGDTCPLPVIKTMNALKELGGAEYCGCVFSNCTCKEAGAMRRSTQTQSKPQKHYRRAYKRRPQFIRMAAWNLRQFAGFPHHSLK